MTTWENWIHISFFLRGRLCVNNSLLPMSSFDAFRRPIRITDGTENWIVFNSINKWKIYLTNWVVEHNAHWARARIVQPRLTMRKKNIIHRSSQIQTLTYGLFIVHSVHMYLLLVYSVYYICMYCVRKYIIRLRTLFLHVVYNYYLQLPFWININNSK